MFVELSQSEKIGSEPVVKFRLQKKKSAHVSTLTQPKRQNQYETNVPEAPTAAPR